MKVKIYNHQGEENGMVELPDSVFGLKWNADLVRQVALGQASNARRGTAHARARGEVRGGGRKPWKQKGTGRARHGSIRSPIWKGGGVTHGPLKEKNYSKKINKKMARKALWTVLSAKVRDNEIVIVENFAFEEAKTRHAADLLRRLSAVKGFEGVANGKKVLVALTGKDDVARRAFRNLPAVGLDEARNLYAHEALQYKYIMFPMRALDSFK